MILRNPNTHGGGANANKTGLSFERSTDLKELLINKGFIIGNNGDVWMHNNLWGYLVPKYPLYTKFFQPIWKPQGYCYKKFISRRLLPDEVFIYVRNRVAHI